ncbi:hypothetical protein [Ornithinimicrobium kibberense]|uniref:hypothetical protein n=1 Tax=Ornithinimicrobium kibberense TaxID=282060 RepID=UPI003607A164
MRSAHMSGETDRMVKYIANRPAKNMISLESQTIVPTAVMLGLVAGPCMVAWNRSASVIVAAGVVATRTLWPNVVDECAPPARVPPPDVPPGHGSRGRRRSRQGSADLPAGPKVGRPGPTARAAHPLRSCP